MASLAPPLHCCLDTLLPRGSRLLAWSDGGEVRVVQGAKGRRVMIFASPGAGVLVAGVPEPALSADVTLREWMQEHPSRSPRWVSGAADGEVHIREIALADIPEAFWSSEVSQPLHALRPAAVRAAPSEESIPTSFPLPTPQEEAARPAESTLSAQVEAMPLQENLGGVEDADPSQAEDEMSMEEFFSSAVEVFRGSPGPLLPPESAEPALPEPTLAEVMPLGLERAEPSLTLPGEPTERTVLLSLCGAEPQVERRPLETRVYGTPGSSFVLVRLPSAEQQDFSAWLTEDALRRPQGYEIGEDARAIAAPSVWVEMLRRGPESSSVSRSAARAWEIMRAEESRQEQGLREVAVAASELRAYVEREHSAPPAIRGSSGVLYARLGETDYDERLEVAGSRVEGAPAHVLRVALPGGREAAWFGPAGGEYRIGAPDSGGSDALCVAVRPSGLRLHLPSSEAQRLWSQGERLSVVEAVPRQAIQPERVTSSPSSPPSSSSVPAAAALTEPLRHAPTPPPRESSPGESQREITPPPADVPMYDPKEDSLANLLDIPQPSQDGPPSYFDDVPLPDYDEAPETEEAPSPEWDESYQPSEGGAPGGGGGKQRASRGGGKSFKGGGGAKKSTAEAAPRPAFVPSEEEVGEVKAVRHDDWHKATQGQMNIDTWKQRSPRGELWASELLETLVDHPDQLESLGCLVPIRLLRAGHQISRSDKEGFDEAFRRLARRVEQVRVFDIEGRSYFARPVGEKIRLIGPRGVLVRTESVREIVARAFEKDPRSCFVEPDEQQVPVGERSAVRRGGR